VKRLKGAIDSRIAEELERQKASQASASRSSSAVRRSSSLAESPSKRSARTRPRVDKNDGDVAARGTDPSEFESEIVVEDEEEPGNATASGQGKNVTEKTGNEGSPEKPVSSADQNGDPKEKTAEAKPTVKSPAELPTDVRVKLRKLEKLESRYQGK
jgi:hypothetical protein